MTGNDITDGESTDDCQLGTPERNRYFHGKLMTARDMAAEQRYARQRFTRHARTVTGQGVVSGLDVSFEPGDDAAVLLTIDPGYAVDCCGRPIVVPNGESVPIDPPEDDEVRRLFLAYEECDRESVPIPGSENACEEECAYNRVLEIFDVAWEPPAPDEAEEPGKPVPSVDFPSSDELGPRDDEGVLEETDPELAVIADSFAREQEVPIGCGESEGHRVYLGTFVEEGGEWTRAAGDSPARVYPNDLLYAATAHHAADFRNPHEVTLEATEADDGAAAVSVEHRDDDPVTVTTVEGEELLSIAVDEADSRIELGGGERIEALIEERLDERLERFREDRIDPLEQYVRDRTLKYKLQTFTLVARRLGGGAGEVAREIVEETRTAIVERAYADPTAFVEFVDDVFDHEEADELREALAELRDEEVDPSYEEALDRLHDALEDAIDEDDETVDERFATEVAVAQDEVCEAAAFIVQTDGDREVTVTTHTAPGEDELRTPEDVSETTVTETDRIADRDNVLVSVSGLADGPNPFDEFEVGSRITDHLDEMDIVLELEELDPGPNREATLRSTRHPADGTRPLWVQHVDAFGDDPAVVLLNSDGLPMHLEPGPWEVRLEIPGRHLGRPDEVVEVTTRFDATERDATLELDGDELPLEEVAVGGETTVAPGTELECRARAGEPGPFLLIEDAPIAADRTFEVTFDFSDGAAGADVTLRVRDVDGDDLAERSVVLEGDEPPEELATYDGTSEELDGESFTAGERFVVTDLEGETVEIREHDSEELVAELPVREGSVTIDTSEFTAEKYFLLGAEANSEAVWAVEPRDDE